MARKALKISLDAGDFYLKVVDEDTWGAFRSAESATPEFTFAAPEDATPGELEAEADCFLLSQEDDAPADEYEDEDEDNYSYNTNW